MKDIYQLMMCCDGYIKDYDRIPEEAVLVAKEVPDDMRRVVAHLNKVNQGKYPTFIFKYWNEYINTSKK